MTEHMLGTWTVTFSFHNELTGKLDCKSYVALNHNRDDVMDFIDSVRENFKDISRVHLDFEPTA